MSLPALAGQTSPVASRLACVCDKVVLCPLRASKGEPRDRILGDNHGDSGSLALSRPPKPWDCGGSECTSPLTLPLAARRPEILKHEMKVFFVKYNDPIYVKLEKLDIMIRLASQANIAQVRSWAWGIQGYPNRSPSTAGCGREQPSHPTCSCWVAAPLSWWLFLAARLSLRCATPQVLAELKEYATEVDVDFVRKAVRAIGRCAIKVEVRAGTRRGLVAPGVGQGSTFQHVVGISSHRNL